MRGWTLLALLAACETHSALPVPIIVRVQPSTWALDSPEDTVAVSGSGFVRHVRADLIDTTPLARREFTGTLGGVELAGITWIDNELLLITPPPDLGPGRHALTIVTPLGHTARMDGAVRVVDRIIDLPSLWVTTAADENDIVSIPLPGTEGELMSLREALLIANFLGAETYVIRFDANVFPPNAPAVIEVATALQQLPPITHDGVVVDGLGAGVEISGVHNPLGNGLTIRANDVWIRGVTIRDFSREHCVHVAQSDRFRLSDCVISGCDQASDSTGAQVVLVAGNGHDLTDNLLLAGGRDGITLSGAPTDVRIEGNRIAVQGDDGVTLGGRGHVLVDNDIEGCGGSGIEAALAENITVVGNRLRDNGDGENYFPSGREHGIEITGASRNWQIADTLFDGNHDAGINLSGFITGVTVSRCTFLGNGDAPITGVRDLEAPTIDSFDGRSLAGSSEPGTIEVYAVDDGDYTFVDTALSNGTWSLDLDSAAAAVAVTVTANGATSEISASRAP